MEFADGGDLLMKIMDHRKRGTYFPEPELWSIHIQTVHGLKALHDLKILHRDLKCANIFLNKDGVVKLGDLNVSKVAKKGLVYTQTGTPYYASPEVWSDKPYDSRSDIWSLGCVLYEAAALNPPFRAQDMQGLYKKVTKGEYPDIPRHYSSDLSNMIRSLLQVNPALRPSCDRILEMPSVIRNSARNSSAAAPQFESPDLLGTIKLTPNLVALRNVLPAPNYDKRGRHLSAHARSPLDMKKDLGDMPRQCNSRDIRTRQEILSPKVSSSRPPAPSSASRAIRPPSRPLSKEAQRPPTRPLSKEIQQRPRIGSRGELDVPSSRPLVKNRSEDIRPRPIHEPPSLREIEALKRHQPPSTREIEALKRQQPPSTREIDAIKRQQPPSAKEIDAIKHQQQIFKNQADSARSPALRYGGQQIMKEYSKNPLLPSPIYSKS
jgi:serine/threonine protein kinase